MSTVHVAIDAHVATITIDRPEARNALSPEVLADLIDVAGAVERNDSVRVVVLTGSGTIFIAGADIARMVAMDGAAAREFARLGGRFTAAIEESRNPWIAKINGAALGGGCEVALACDVIIAADSAIFGQPEVTLGTMPGWGATQRLPRRVGFGKALELCLGGAVIDATEAGRIGLADTVVPADALDGAVAAFAAKIAANAPDAVADTKRMVRQGYDLPLAEGLAREAERFAATFTRGDTVEGMGAFLEKPRRTPTFHRS